MNARSVPTLSPSSRKTLDRHIERALQQRFGARGSLRHVVQTAVLELAAHGTSGDEIRELLVRSVEQHPRVHRWDRVSIVTGLSTSVDLTRRMLDWADPATDALPSEEPAPATQRYGTPTPGNRPAARRAARWLDDGDA